MSIVFSPDGILNVAADASDLPESGDGKSSYSGAMVRCKNLRIQSGKAKTRDGSAKLNSTPISTDIWHIEEQDGERYTFAGTQIYKNESSIETGLTNAKWSAVKYSAFNDTNDNIFALNGTDRKRIESDTVYEWGIAAPTVAPTLSAGQGTGLTGLYNAKYTYVRKVSGATVAESNPSPEADTYIDLNNQSLVVDATAPSDSQVTHIRLYRTSRDGVIYYRDQDIPTATYSYGACYSWEGSDGYLSGETYKFTVTDSTHGTENTYSWESDLTMDIEDSPSYGGNDWYSETEAYFDSYILYVLSSGGVPISYGKWLSIYG